MADSDTSRLLYCVLEDFLDNKINFLAISNVINSLFLLHHRWKREYLPRVGGFVEQTIPDFLDEDFRTHFRIGKQMFVTIVETLGMDLIRSHSGGLIRVIPEKQVLVFLSYMATQESMRQISLYFGIGKSTVHGILRNVKTCFIAKFLKVIKWPDRNEQRVIAGEFRDQRGLPGIVGALDGSHIRLSSALGGDNDYYNRKQFPSVQLQLVCDHQMLIRHMYTGWPGCTHDARVLRNSSLQDILERGDLDQGSYIIADSAYPLRENLITPFKDNGYLNARQRRFNKALSATRQVVERCIGHLKGRFRRLREITVHDINDVISDITSGCILSNLCILDGENIDQYMLPPDANDHPNMYANIYHDRVNGVVRRQQLVNGLL